MISVPDAPPMPSHADGRGERPWRCPLCRYDVGGLALGERCSECGNVLDERSLVPRWMRDARPAGIRKWALVGLGANLLPLAAALLITVLANVLPQPEQSMMFLIVAGTAVALHVVLQLVASLRIASLDSEPGRSRRLRLTASSRSAAIVVGTTVLVVAVRIKPTGFEVIQLVAMFVIPAVLVACDVLAARTAARLARDADVGPSSWRRLALHGATAVLALSYPLFLIPFVGWVFAPIAWCIANAVSFGVIAHTMTLVARRAGAASSA